MQLALDRNVACGDHLAMRTLMLMRHAKSSWATPGLDDHERPLNKRGVKEAPRIGAYLAKNGLCPDLVLCSDAARTRATLSLVLSALGGTAPKVMFEPRLYLAEPAAITEVLARVEPAAMRVLVIGHNPGLHALALWLVGDGSAETIAELSMKFPTCALAVIDIERRGWESLEPGTGRLRHFVVGKHL